MSGLLGRCILVYISLFLLAVASSTRKIYSSCIGLVDGKYTFQLQSGGKLITAKCSNEYIILDYSLDSRLSSYFSSFVKWHSMVGGPIKNDHPNWHSWFTPMTQYSDADFIVAPECSVCDESSEWQLHRKKTAYYMNSFGFTCFDPKRGVTACDADFYTQDCNYCGWDRTGQHLLTYKRDLITQTWEDLVDDEFGIGVCNFELRRSSQKVLTTYSECTNEERAWKPTIGMKGEKCMCFKPIIVSTEDDKYAASVTDVDDSLLIAYDTLPVHMEDDSAPQDSVIYLYQRDFKYGTYRITNAGNYKIMEDIVFDFNGVPAYALADKSISPNDPSLNYYWPTDNIKYPGAGQARDPYFLGYFAGITIECNDVDLDLGGHELSMSKAFFFQQPYFALIELSSQPFIPQQGPGIFGSDIKSASNAHIHNGRLGRTSHHAIHGNYNSDISIHDLQVYNFFSHGIQLNGFDGVSIENVDIGPNTREAQLNAGYSHLRFLLPNALRMANLQKSYILYFRGVRTTMGDILSKTVELMDEALYYALDPLNNEISDEASLFLNKNGKGIPFGTVCYGLFLNYPGAGIFGWHSNNFKSNDLILNNIEVHDMVHMGVEVIGGTYMGRAFANAFAAPLDFLDLFGDRTALYSFGVGRAVGTSDPVIHYPYVGNLISDFHLAFYKIGSSMNDFDLFPGISYVGVNDELLLWAEQSNEYLEWMSNINREIHLICNQDAMFHSGKGLLGIKINGVNDVRMDHISVYNLQDFTHLGCAPELQTNDHAKNFFVSMDPDDNTIPNNFFALSQQKPYQLGYSMNMVMGISIDHTHINQFSNIAVHHLLSETGLAYGVALWFKTTLQFSNEFHASYIVSGRSVEQDLFQYTDLPNRNAESCAFRVLGGKEAATITYDSSFDIKDMRMYCITGNTGCLGEDDVFTSLGKVGNQECGDLTQLEIKDNGHLFNTAVNEEQKKNNMNIFGVFDISYLPISAIILFIAIPIMVALFALRIYCKRGKKNILISGSASTHYQSI